LIDPAAGSAANAATGVAADGLANDDSSAAE
jgi:hypothetical protein